MTYSSGRCSGGVARFSIAALAQTMGGQSSSAGQAAEKHDVSKAVDRGFKSGTDRGKSRPEHHNGRGGTIARSNGQWAQQDPPA